MAVGRKAPIGDLGVRALMSVAQHLAKFIELLPFIPPHNGTAQPAAPLAT